MPTYRTLDLQKLRLAKRQGGLVVGRLFLVRLMDLDDVTLSGPAHRSRPWVATIEPQDEPEVVKSLAECLREDGE